VSFSNNLHPYFNLEHNNFIKSNGGNTMKKFTIALLAAVLVLLLLSSGVLAGVGFGPRILAGQDFQVGWNRVWNDGDSINIRFIVDAEDWCLKEFHVHAGATLADFPFNPGGGLKIGHFDYAEEFDVCVNVFTLEIPHEDLAALGIIPGDEFYLAIHSVVINTVTGAEETGWTVRCGDLAGAQFGGPGWAAYVKFTAIDWVPGDPD
jgi:hypothetical protein